MKESDIINLATEIAEKATQEIAEKLGHTPPSHKEDTVYLIIFDAAYELLKRRLGGKDG